MDGDEPDLPLVALVVSAALPDGLFLAEGLEDDPSPALTATGFAGLATATGADTGAGATGAGVTTATGGALAGAATVALATPPRPVDGARAGTEAGAAAGTTVADPTFAAGLVAEGAGRFNKNSKPAPANTASAPRTATIESTRVRRADGAVLPQEATVPGAALIDSEEGGNANALADSPDN